jgi:CRP/FNR family transcriptional regulator, cyclic AMP receptor protein
MLTCCVEQAFGVALSADERCFSGIRCGCILGSMSTVGPGLFAIGDDWVPVLKPLPLFEGMSSRHLRRIPAKARRFQPGEAIVRAGDPGSGFYMILDGEVRVDPPEGRPVVLKAGDYFGEMALLDGAPRSADITALGEVTVMVIARAAFSKLLRSEPQIAQVLLRTLAGRLRAAEKQF